MKMNVRIEDRTYEVSIEDILDRPIRVNVDGEVFEVWPEEGRASAVPQQPAAVSAAKPLAVLPAAPARMPSSGPKINDNQVNAPIPGMIIDVLVSAGDAVVYGQELCILEAMKMKNSIRSGREGVIEQVLVSSGQQVSQNQALMVYRPEGK